MGYTVVLLKPDCVKRGLMGACITRLELAHLKIEEMMMMDMDELLIREHYSHCIDTPYFERIMRHMTAGPIVAILVSGEDAVKSVRDLVGATMPEDAEIGTIRGDYGISMEEGNLIHASDSEESADKEFYMFFAHI